jgi:hypothetical protein
MTVVIWIAGALALIFAVVYLVPIITGLLMPRSVSGALLLKRELKANGVATDGLPQQFFGDCVRWAERVALFAEPDPLKPGKLASTANFTETLQNLARTAALRVREPESIMFKPYGDTKNGYRALFENYNLKRAA